MNVLTLRRKPIDVKDYRLDPKKPAMRGATSDDYSTLITEYDDHR